MHFDRIQDKGGDRDREAYSGFDGTDLAGYLRDRGVERVLVTGVATDYCVRATALDAVREGFLATVLTDAVAAVDVHAGDGARALAEVAAAGGAARQGGAPARRVRARAHARAQGAAAARGDRTRPDGGRP